MLRALLAQNKQAWCFLPLDDDVVQLCSREFLALWRIPGEFESGEVAIEPGVELTSETFQCAAENLGIAGSWLTDIVTSRHPVTITRNDGLSVRAVTQPVFDGDGSPIGRLVSFQVVTNSRSLESIVNRSLQAQARLTVLTPRENEVLRMLYDGFTNKAVAIRMKISDKTVEKHRAKVMDKLGVRNVVELVRLVTEAEIADISFWSAESGR
ncbi:MAG: LuxR C-terminal-related transcriptional regulator [Planctomycetaceae bacterium]